MATFSPSPRGSQSLSLSLDLSVDGEQLLDGSPYGISRLDFLSPPAPPPPPPQRRFSGGLGGDSRGTSTAVGFVSKRGSYDQMEACWMDDGYSDGCMVGVCESRFSFWTRRHHCRCCGQCARRPRRARYALSEY